MDKVLLSALQKAFRCHINGVRPRRNVWLVKTDRGMWIVKGYKQKDKAEWVTNLADTLYEHGFYHTVQYLKDWAGNRVIPVGSHYYTVMKAINGREADHSLLLDVKRSISTLARFHQAARGFPLVVPIAGYQPPLLDKWEGRLEDFKRILKTIKTHGVQNRLEQIIQVMAEDVLRDATETIERSYKIQLMGEMNQAAVEGTLAHRDVASHNFLISPRGSCYLIDLDTVSYDMQLADLVQFFGRILLMHGYSLYTFFEGIDAYNKIKPLNDNQVWMIHQLLRYPDNFLREVTGVYGKRHGYRARNVQHLLLMEARYREERKRFLAAEGRILQRSPWGGYHLVG